MAFIAFVGKMRSGKSFLATKKGIELAIERRKRLVFNYPVSLDKLALYANLIGSKYLLDLINNGGVYFADSSDIRSLFKVSNSIVIGDELGVFLNARNYKDMPKDLIADIPQSAKMGIDLLFVCQFWSQVDKQITIQTEDVYHVSGKVKYDVSLGNYRLLKQSWIRYDRESYELWLNSPKARINPIRSRFAYGNAGGGGKLKAIDGVLFDVYQSFARLDKVPSAEMLDDFSSSLGRYYYVSQPNKVADYNPYERHTKYAHLVEQDPVILLGVHPPGGIYATLGKYPVWPRTFQHKLTRSLYLWVPVKYRHKICKTVNSFMELFTIPLFFVGSKVIYFGFFVKMFLGFFLLLFVVSRMW